MTCVMHEEDKSNRGAEQAIVEAAMAASTEGTVIFASVGRSHYGFDVVSCDPQTLQETPLTDGISINFNAQFVDDPVALQLAAAGDGAFAAHPSSDGANGAATACDSGLVYVSERTGSSSIFFTPLSKTSHGLKAGPVLGPLKGADAESGFYYCDKPSVANGRAIYVSTKTSKQEEEEGLRKLTTAVFSTCLKTGETARLSPDGVADYSPAVSPSKEWVIVASNQGEEWSGAIHELDTALCIFRAEDGSRRKLVVERGGWPTWADDSTIFFHKKAPDEWWSVYKVVLPENLNDLQGPLEPERVTPPGVHAFTPAASNTGNWIAVATRRPGSQHRHVEILDLASKSFVQVTRKLHPGLHHFNPFVCPTSGMIGFHRSNKNRTIPLLEPVAARTPSNVTLLRIDGAFPSVSPDGSLIAYNTDFEAEDSGVFVAKLDGSGRKRIFKGLAFTTSWDCKRPGVVYTSVGNIFAEERATVHILSLTFDVAEFHTCSSSSSSARALSASSTKVLTKPGTKNNAFPCSSPDGKHIVFRSGRSGHKNLYIMNAEEGEEAGIRALTEGAWVDTMPSWSPDGQWIGFSSTRDDPGSGQHFGLYLVRPDGTDLHRVLPPAAADESGHIRGRFNHVCFSPDSRTLLFTADSAAVSAEPISVANQFQPYGELFSCNLDGSGLVRWTHNAYEDGTPCWGPIRIDPKSLSDEGVELNTNFQDCLWLNNVTEKMKQAAASAAH